MAQNSFTIKIIDDLLEYYKNSAESSENKTKNIQLGHNTINPRKCRDKIEELRQYGVTISLWLFIAYLISFIIIMAENKPEVPPQEVKEEEEKEKVEEPAS